MEPTWRVVEFDANGDGEIACENLSAAAATFLMEVINDDGGHAAIELEDWHEPVTNYSGRPTASVIDSLCGAAP